MKWGFLSITHIITLILAVALNVVLYFLIRKLDRKKQDLVLIPLSFLGIAAILFNLLRWGSPFEYLPLHLCSLSAVILPYVTISKNKIAGNLLLLWSLGAFVALILNTSVSEANVFSFTFFFYYFPHVFECGIPIVMLLLKHFKLDAKCIISTIIITLVIYTGIHFANLALNSYFIKNNVLNKAGEVIQVNYMFSIKPDNPVLEIFYKLIPHQYWYMLLSLPIIIIYLSIIYGSYYLAKRKQKISK